MNNTKIIKRLESWIDNCPAFLGSEFKHGINTAIDVVKELSEPTPVIPKDIADWLEVCKENLGFGLASAMNKSTFAMQQQSEEVQEWFDFRDNQEKFASAWLYGYKIEEETLYEVFQERTGAQLSALVPGSTEFKSQFTLTELGKCGFHNLDEYEIREVEND